MYPLQLRNLDFLSSAIQHASQDSAELGAQPANMFCTKLVTFSKLHLIQTLRGSCEHNSNPFFLNAQEEHPLGEKI